MQEKFLRGIKQMNEVVKEGSTAEREELLETLNKDFCGPVTTEKVLAVQEHKVMIMESLREALEQLSNTGTVGIEGKMRSGGYKEDTKTLFCFGKNGEEVSLSRG